MSTTRAQKSAVSVPQVTAPVPQVTVPAARLVFSEEDRAEILLLVDESLRTGALTLGPVTARFESAFATRQHVDHAIATSSGTSALEIILRCLGVSGAEVVVPTNTFFATAAAVAHAGGRPRLADVAPDTMALSAATVEAALTDATAGVVLVHIGGVITPEVHAIAELCRHRGLFLVEDAAHAHGSELDGVPAGGFGRAAAFSFYPTKVVTSAEGGMIVTDDAELAAEAVVYRDQGKASFGGGGHIRLGYAWRMSEPNAAIGLVHLRHVDEFVELRNAVARRYDAGLASIDEITAIVPPIGVNSNFYKYPALLDTSIDRARLKQRLRDEHGVWMSGEVYATPLHHEPVFAALAGLPALSVAEDLCARHVCLPVHSNMTDAEVDLVIKALGDVLRDEAHTLRQR